MYAQKRSLSTNFATMHANASVMEIQISKIIGQEGPAILLELFLTIQRLITGTENRPG